MTNKKTRTWLFSVWKVISYILKDVRRPEERNEVHTYTVLNKNTVS